MVRSSQGVSELAPGLLCFDDGRVFFCLAFLSLKTGCLILTEILASAKRTGATRLFDAVWVTSLDTLDKIAFFFF